MKKKELFLKDEDELEDDKDSFKLIQNPLDGP